MCRRPGASHRRDHAGVVQRLLNERMASPLAGRWKPVPGNGLKGIRLILAAPFIYAAVEIAQQAISARVLGLVVDVRIKLYSGDGFALCAAHGARRRPGVGQRIFLVDRHQLRAHRRTGHAATPPAIRPIPAPAGRSAAPCPRSKASRACWPSQPRSSRMMLIAHDVVEIGQQLATYHHHHVERAGAAGAARCRGGARRPTPDR